MELELATDEENQKMKQFPCQVQMYVDDTDRG